MLSKVKQHAKVLHSADLQLSNKAIIGMQIESYNRQVYVISELVQKVCAHLASLCGKEVPYATVCMTSGLAGRERFLVYL
jgi:hypothetical protein